MQHRLAHIDWEDAMKTLRGSLTVEATLSFTIFLMVFLALLSVVKIGLIEYQLRMATSNASRSVATSSYVLGKVNAWQEEENKKKINSTSESMVFGEIKEGVSDISSVLTGVIKYAFADKSKPSKSIKAGTDLKITSGEAAVSFVTSFIGMGVDSLYSHLYSYIGDAKDALAYRVVRAAVENNLAHSALKLDGNNLNIDIYKLPQTQAEFESNMLNVSYVVAGLSPGVDFGKDDVVISISYKYKLKFPFIKEREIILRSTSVEKAWLNGSSGVYCKPRSDTGLLSTGISELFELIDNETVYIVDGSNKYHRSAYCPAIDDKHYTTLKKLSAKNLQYKECSQCQ